MDFMVRALGQKPSLDRWRQRAIHPRVLDGPAAGDHLDLHQRVVGQEPPGPPLEQGPHRRVAKKILAYHVFPDRVISGVVDRVPVEVGDTIGAAFHLGPGVDVFFASRVSERFDGETNGLWRTGFTYQTLVGHPELGQETFSVEKNLSTGQVMVALRAWSRPGTWLARLTRPLARHWQLTGSLAALDNLENAARGSSHAIGQVETPGGVGS